MSLPSDNWGSSINGFEQLDIINYLNSNMQSHPLFQMCLQIENLGSLMKKQILKASQVKQLYSIQADKPKDPEMSDQDHEERVQMYCQSKESIQLLIKTFEETQKGADEVNGTIFQQLGPQYQQLYEAWKHTDGSTQSIKLFEDPI